MITLNLDFIQIWSPGCRYYVQPQWVFDCVNARMLLPVKDYFMGETLPPHLSPFVSEQEGEYVPPEKQQLLNRQRGIDSGMSTIGSLGSFYFCKSHFAMTLDATTLTYSIDQLTPVFQYTHTAFNGQEKSGLKITNTCKCFPYFWTRLATCPLTVSTNEFCNFYKHKIVLVDTCDVTVSMLYVLSGIEEEEEEESDNEEVEEADSDEEEAEEEDSSDEEEEGSGEEG